MRLSIVIPTKNEEKNLPLLLNQIREQTVWQRWPDEIEVIVADAHSTDKTREIAKQLGAKVVDGGMPGPGRNRGAEAAHGTWLAFFDADVALPSVSYLEHCLLELEQRAVDIATCRFLPMDGNLLDDIGHWFYNTFVILTQHWIAHAGGSCIFAKRAIHEQIKGFDETVVFAEDMEYVQRAQKQGSKFRVLRRHPILVSLRRIVKEGRLLFVWKLIYTEFYMRFVGPVRKELFRYEFANYK